MIDLLLAAVTFPLIVAVGLLALAAVTLVPFVLALQMADERAFSTTRWGTVALVGSLLPLTFTWAGPGLLWMLTGEEAAVGGRSGAHE